MSDGMCDAETKKGISSTLRRAPFPSLHRTVSGSRSFPMTWTRPLNFGPDAKRPTSPERTAAFDRRRRKKLPSFPNLRPPCLCQKTGPGCSRIRGNPVRKTNITRFLRASMRKTAQIITFSGKNAFFSNLYKFAVQVSPGKRAPKCHHEAFFGKKMENALLFFCTGVY